MVWGREEGAVQLARGGEARESRGKVKLLTAAILLSDKALVDREEKLEGRGGKVGIGAR